MADTPTTSAGIADHIDHVARTAYGKLVAILASRSRDIMEAEDAVAHAFARALNTWPQKGVPEKPEAWLLTVARNHLVDKRKSAAERLNAPLDDQALETMPQASVTPTIENDVFPDERLKLMFACSHPAIESTIRAPLMLQTVLGMEAAEIAKLFLIPSATLSQRLVRAKRKIKDAGIPFRIPDPEEMAERLDCVLDAIYAAYSAGWDLAPEVDLTQDRGVEAVHLSGVLVGLLPKEPEALGLAALLAYSAGRDEARRDADGNYVPLNEQDTSLWDTRWLDRGDRLLARAREVGGISTYQLEAAIQAAHCDRRKTGQTPWVAIIQLYDGLIALAPSAGATVARAAAVAEAHGPDAGMKALCGLDEKARSTFQPAHALEAHLQAQLGDASAADVSYERAINLSTEPHVRRWLEKKRQALSLN